MRSLRVHPLRSRPAWYYLSVENPYTRSDFCIKSSSDVTSTPFTPTLSNKDVISMGPKLAVKSLDHLVLTVRSIPAAVEFYTQHLGMRHEAFRSPKDVSIERYVSKNSFFILVISAFTPA